MQYTAFLLLVPLSLVIISAILIYAWRQRKVPEIAALLVMISCVAGWLVFNTLELIAASPAMTMVWARISYLFIATTPTAWFVFVLVYTGAGDALRSPGFWAIALIPVATVALAWTNGVHGLVWRDVAYVPVNGLLAMRVEHGPWFWVYASFGYSLVGLGAFLIVIRHFRAQSLYRYQSRWLVAGALIPVIVNIVYVTDLIPGLQKDFTPVGFALAGLAFAVGIFRFRLFDIKPVARVALVDTLSDPVITLDRLDRVVDLNPAALTMFTGLTAERSPDLIGRPMDTALGSFPSLVSLLQRAEATHADVLLERASISQSYDVRVSNLLNTHGQRLGRVIVLRDITERKQAEAALRRHMAELEASNEQLDAFAHTVAHDLKGPLSTMIGYTEVLLSYLDTLPPEDVKEQLEMLREGGYSMARIVDALLLLARTRQQTELVVEPLDMAFVVNDALERVAPLVVGQDVTLTAPPSWPQALGYAPWVVEVWVNYLSNAIKYGGKPPCVTLGCEALAAGEGTDGRVAPEDASPAFFRFWVRDNGPGLTAEEAVRLFTPFTRLQPTRAAGHGLGLTIVRRIVERLGGRVGVESQAGQGSTFWFTLPGV